MRSDPHPHLLTAAAASRAATNSRPSPPPMATHTQTPRAPELLPPSSSSEPELSGTLLGGPGEGLKQEHALLAISIAGGIEATDPVTVTLTSVRHH